MQEREHLWRGLNYNGKCYVSHSACPEEVAVLKDLIEARFPNLVGKVETNTIGTVIGSHTGPGTFVVFFWGDVRVD